MKLIQFRKKIATLLPLETLKSENFRHRRVYEIGVIANRDVSPPFGAAYHSASRRKLL